MQQYEQFFGPYIIGRLAEYLRCGDLLRYFYEPNAAEDLISDIETASTSNDYMRKKSWKDVWEFSPYRLCLYAITRELRPTLAIETGVLHGFTSNFILSAMRHNSYGSLISIDLPSYYQQSTTNNDGFLDTLPKDCEPGWMIANRNRSHWSCRLGSSQTELQALVEEKIVNGNLDFFIHDSEHTYQTMWFELNFAWNHLRTGGILVCDNIDYSTAFFDFCRRVGASPFVVPDTAARFGKSHRIRFGVLERD